MLNLNTVQHLAHYKFVHGTYVPMGSKGRTGVALALWTHRGGKHDVGKQAFLYFV